MKTNLQPPLFSITRAKHTPLPIIISVPHSGLQIPDSIKQTMDPQVAHNPSDTDFFVDQVYSFAPNLGITMIKANYSRYVADLNRNPDNKPLYPGRAVTSVVPQKTFAGQNIYLTDSSFDIQERVAEFHQPYYHAVEQEIQELKKTYKNVLVWDGHSIERVVPKIHPDPLVDLMLGSRDQSSADPSLIDLTQKLLSESKYSFAHDAIFKGGNITHHFSHPSKGRHTLQLEMSKDIYMDTSTNQIDQEKTTRLQALLKSVLLQLADVVCSL